MCLDMLTPIGARLQADHPVSGEIELTLVFHAGSLTHYFITYSEETANQTLNQKKDKHIPWDEIAQSLKTVSLEFGTVNIRLNYYHNRIVDYSVTRCVRYKV